MLKLLEPMAFYLSCVIIATVPVYFAAVQPWVWPFKLLMSW